MARKPKYKWLFVCVSDDLSITERVSSKSRLNHLARMCARYHRNALRIAKTRKMENFWKDRSDSMKVSISPIVPE